MDQQHLIALLTDVLKKETDAASSMEVLLKEKRGAFVRWSTGELSQAVAQEESIISSLSALEKERMAVIRSLSRRERRILSMKEILERHPSDDLRRSYEELQRVSSRVVRWNNQNRDLVQSSLSFVRRTLSAITGNFRYKLLDQKV